MVRPGTTEERILQRGRALVSAEIAQHASSILYALLLQRGRALVSAEIQNTLGAAMRSARLQRGRALVSAEIRRRDRRGGNTRYFNGAALW